MFVILCRHECVLTDMGMRWIPWHVGRLAHVPVAEQSVGADISGFVKVKPSKQLKLAIPPNTGDVMFKM